jgi:hypothetical protein
MWVVDAPFVRSSRVAQPRRVRLRRTFSLTELSDSAIALWVDANADVDRAAMSLLDQLEKAGHLSGPAEEFSI